MNEDSKIINETPKIFSVGSEKINETPKMFSAGSEKANETPFALNEGSQKPKGAAELMLAWLLLMLNQPLVWTSGMAVRWVVSLQKQGI